MKRTRLGMLTPSSNTTLELVCARMLGEVPGVTAHFGRFRVTEISLGDAALRQFTEEPMLEAADLLADARCDAICWNGTSAGWLGFDADRRLCAGVTARTGIAACSSVLAIDEIFRATGVRRYALVTPYIDDIQTAIIANFEREGYTCVAERHRGIRVNFDFSEIPSSTIERMIVDVAEARPQAILVFCTNMDGASLAERLEREVDVPIYDTIATAVWASLRAAGIAPSVVRGWGRLFRDVR